MSIKERAIETLDIEGKAVLALKDRIGDEFVAAVNCILRCPARVVVTGMGKSGHVGRKIAATLASTGTPSFFLHPAEAFHGDLGMVTENDVVIAISNSGESTEIVNILPIIRRIGATIIAMSGRRESQLGKFCDYFIDISVEREACPEEAEAFEPPYWFGREVTEDPRFSYGKLAREDGTHLAKLILARPPKPWTPDDFETLGTLEMNGFADLARPSDTEVQAAPIVTDEQSVPSGPSDQSEQPDSAEIVPSDEPEEQEEDKTPDTSGAEKAETKEEDGMAR